MVFDPQILHDSNRFYAKVGAYCHITKCRCLTTVSDSRTYLNVITFNRINDNY